MSQLSFPSNVSSLLVRDALGRYLPASAEEILTAARRVVDLKVRRGTSLTCPVLVKQYLAAKLAAYEHEVFSVLFMDTQLQLIEYVEMFHGTVDSAAVYPREVVKRALRCNAAAVILAHNHTSGNPEPSATDKVLTRQLREVLAMVDVRIVDHVIVAGVAITSMAERGCL